MNKSPIYPRMEVEDYSGSCEFDYQADFTQFLEEAKKNASNGNSNSAQLEGPGMKKQLDGEKKYKKSWKSSLFSWFNVDKKTKSTKHQKNDAVVSKPTREYVSGPVHGIGGGVARGRVGRPASGPLTGLFGSRSGGEEYEGPYMCLNKLSDPQKIPSYGPVYLVT